MFPRASCKKERTLRTFQTDRESRGLGGVRTLRPQFSFQQSMAIVTRYTAQRFYAFFDDDRDHDKCG